MLLIVSSFACPSESRVPCPRHSSGIRGSLGPLVGRVQVLGQAFDVVVDDLLSCVHCFDAMGCRELFVISRAV